MSSGETTNSDSEESPFTETLQNELDRQRETADKAAVHGTRVIQFNGIAVSVFIGLITYKGNGSDLQALAAEPLILIGSLMLGVSTMMAIAVLVFGTYGRSKPDIHPSHMGNQDGSDNGEMKLYKQPIAEYTCRIKWMHHLIIFGTILGFGSVPVFGAGFIRTVLGEPVETIGSLPSGVVITLVFLPLGVLLPVLVIRRWDRAALVNQDGCNSTFNYSK